MLAGIILVTALMMLATQLTGHGATGAWPSITLASQLNIPPDRVLSDWTIIDRTIRFLLSQVQLWVLMIFAAGLIYWLMDWTSEMLARLFGARPATASLETH
jgi:hypothetical protein